MLVSFGHPLSRAKTQGREERRMFFWIALAGGCWFLLGIRYLSQRRKERRMFFLDCISGMMLVIFGHPLFLAKTQGREERNFIWITDTLPNLSTSQDLLSYLLFLTSYFLLPTS